MGQGDREQEKGTREGKPWQDGFLGNRASCTWTETGVDGQIQHGAGGIKNRARR